jgi:hypothetical protein
LLLGFYGFKGWILTAVSGVLFVEMTQCAG